MKPLRIGRSIAPRRTAAISRAIHFLLILGPAGSAFSEDPAPPGAPAASGSRDVAAQPSSTPSSSASSPQPASPDANAAPGSAGEVNIPDPNPVASSAVVIEVSGSVDWAVAGVSPLATDGWHAVKVDDRLLPGSQIRTGLRSHVNLRFGETTLVSVRSATHASIDQFFRSATAEKVEVGLAYGTIRGGSVESTIHSDVRVDSTVATLAKRGTEGWEMRVEPQTGRYRISLSESGLVDAFQKLAAGRQLSKEVRPGEYATRDNIANLWINQSAFDRTIQFFEADSMTSADAGFSTDNARGYGVIAPGAGSQLRDSARRTSAAFVREQAGDRTGVLPPRTVVIERGPIRRPDGDFGTGNTLKVLLPVAGTRK